MPEKPGPFVVICGHRELHRPCQYFFGGTENGTIGTIKFSVPALRPNQKVRSFNDLRR